MRLFAAIVPPRDVVDDICRVVESLNAPSQPAEESSRGFLRRFSGRGSHGGAHAARRAPVQTENSAVRSRTDELDTPEPDRMHLPIAGFGNVTLGDSVKLAKALREVVATWSGPHVVFRGGAALEFTGDESVWVKLEGDVDALMTIGRGVPTTVQRLGFFVDRRQFRPWLSVGTITEATTAPYLERLVAALDELRSEPWTVEAVHLMRNLPESEEKDAFEVMERLPLG